MSSTTTLVDVTAAEDYLMKFLLVEGVTGQEAAIAAAVSDELENRGPQLRHPLRRREQAHQVPDSYERVYEATFMIQGYAVSVWMRPGSVVSAIHA
jgi:hypothetical protein